MIESPTTYGIRRVEEVIEPVDPTPYLDVLDHRFGIPRATFEPYLVHQPNRHSVWIVRRDLRLPTRPELHTVGVPFFYTDMRWPRPTTYAAIRWGSLARRRRIDLGAVEIARLLRREELPIRADRATEVDGTGYVLLRHRGAVLGLGFFRATAADADDSDAVGTLRSMIPRSWTTQLGIEPPPTEPIDWRLTEQPAVG